MKISEKTLSILFDYQRFENDRSLEELIDNAEDKYSAELSDDDLSSVSAAGEPRARKKKDFEDGRS